jgi:hypothetical protein
MPYICGFEYNKDHIAASFTACETKVFLLMMIDDYYRFVGECLKGVQFIVGKAASLPLLVAAISHHLQEKKLLTTSVFPSLF